MCLLPPENWRQQGDTPFSLTISLLTQAMHLSFALFRQRATAAALYAPLTELMQALGLKRLSYGVVVDKTHANGELTHEGKGIRRPALEAGLADGSIVSFNLGKGQLMSDPDMVVAYVNDARHGSAYVQVHVPLAWLGEDCHPPPLLAQDVANALQHGALKAGLALPFDESSPAAFLQVGRRTWPTSGRTSLPASCRLPGCFDC